LLDYVRQDSNPDIDINWNLDQRMASRLQSMQFDWTSVRKTGGNYHEDGSRNRESHPSARTRRARAWFATFDAAAWDRQFEQDVTEGRLDHLADEALKDLREGRRIDL
jgi:hypothetical protein